MNSCIQSSCFQSYIQSRGFLYANPQYAKLTLIVFFYSLIVYTFLNGLCIGATQGGDDYAISSLMEEGEKEAFYNVLEALNSGWDWRSSNPDPCGGSSPQGTTCDQWGGLWHLTAMSLGPVYDNSPSCASDARIHPSISKLTHLESLSFYQCFTRINTTIPSEIANLKASLKSLSFRNNVALGGAIPATFGELLNLERLVITGNSLEGTIPMELGKLELLAQLDLSNNKLSGEIPSSLGSLRELTVLDLSNNYLNGKIPASLGGLSRLEKLDFSRNKLEEFIPYSMGSLRSLKLLDLRNNKLQGSLPSSLGELASLQELYLGNNNFNGALPINVWGQLKQLMSLDLSDADFEGLIPLSFGSLDSLRYLTLENNKLTGGIPSGLGRLSHIYLLHLNGNNLSGQLPFTSAFVERLGPNLLLSGNEGLCSLVPYVNGVNNIRVCPSSSEEAHQLSSKSTLLSHLKSNWALPSCPSPNLLLTLFTCILVLRVHS